jgi:hypothetical protein
VRRAAILGLTVALAGCATGNPNDVIRTQADAIKAAVAICGLFGDGAPALAGAWHVKQHDHHWHLWLVLGAEKTVYNVDIDSRTGRALPGCAMIQDGPTPAM